MDDLSKGHMTKEKKTASEASQLPHWPIERSRLEPTSRSEHPLAKAGKAVVERLARERVQINLSVAACLGLIGGLVLLGASLRRA